MRDSHQLRDQSTVEHGATTPADRGVPENAPPGVPHKPTANPLTADAVDEAKPQPHPSQVPRTTWRRFTSASRIMAITSIVIMAATVANVVVAAMQWKASRASVAIAEQALKEARRSGEESGKATRDALAVSAAQLDAFQKQLASYRLAEGARLGIGAIEWNASEGRAWLSVENYGRISSPRALIFVNVFRIVTGSKDKPPFRFEHQTYSFGGDRTETPPGTGKRLVEFPLAVSPEEMGLLQRRERQLMVGVTIKYDDGFGQERLGGISYSFAPPNRWALASTVNFIDLGKLGPTEQLAPEGHGRPFAR